MSGSMPCIRLIVGLGNPGRNYEKTRHNAGIWFIEKLLNNQISSLKPTKKFHGLFGQVSLWNENYYILLPTTYMNLSGLAVGAAAKFYHLSPTSILIAHDELDLPPGTARFKQDGGHAGHNGLQDIISHLGGSKDFYRLRIGIGRPPANQQTDVKDYVLNRPSKADKQKIDQAIEKAIDTLPLALSGRWDQAMQKLHA